MKSIKTRIVFSGCVEPFARTFRASLTEGESHPHGDRTTQVIS